MSILAVPKEKTKTRKITGKITKEEMRKMREKDNRIVSGVFRYHDCRGGKLKFSFKKYEGDPVEPYEMVDGKKYDVPFMVAEHLNKNCNYPKHAHVLDANGNPIVHVGENVQRCSFENLDFSNTEK